MCMLIAFRADVDLRASITVTLGHPQRHSSALRVTSPVLGHASARERHLSSQTPREADDRLCQADEPT
nr:hypothetical protein BgiMline_012213 [Biomphalaria glabrata]